MKLHKLADNLYRVEFKCGLILIVRSIREAIERYSNYKKGLEV